MDLPPDKAKVLRSYDDEKKWEMIRDQEKVTAKQTPDYYLNKLRAYLDPKAGRSSKKRRMLADCNSTQLLRHLEISLRTNSIEWVRDFLSDQHRGLDVLHEYLTFRLAEQRQQQQAQAMQQAQQAAQQLQQQSTVNGSTVGSTVGNGTGNGTVGLNEESFLGSPINGIVNGLNGSFERNGWDLPGGDFSRPYTLDPLNELNGLPGNGQHSTPTSPPANGGGSTWQNVAASTAVSLIR